MNGCQYERNSPNTSGEFHTKIICLAPITKHSGYARITHFSVLFKLLGYLIINTKSDRTTLFILWSR
ncbi:uncharacterized protein METZ01_LOCUS342774 [marine metagenome]|uniref:Uncharacterized protein n=1 Tax=marine metagenome TaxID=408172 RepID=A0A382QYB6_9ZZZZ